MTSCVWYRNRCNPLPGLVSFQVKWIIISDYLHRFIIIWWSVLTSQENGVESIEILIQCGVEMWLRVSKISQVILPDISLSHDDWTSCSHTYVHVPLKPSNKGHLCFAAENVTSSVAESSTAGLNTWPSTCGELADHLKTRIITRPKYGTTFKVLSKLCLTFKFQWQWLTIRQHMVIKKLPYC